MDDINYDQEIEKRGHPENFNTPEDFEAEYLQEPIEDEEGAEK